MAVCWTHIFFGRLIYFELLLLIWSASNAHVASGKWQIIRILAINFLWAGICWRGVSFYFCRKFYFLKIDFVNIQYKIKFVLVIGRCPHDVKRPENKCLEDCKKLNREGLKSLKIFMTIVVARRHYPVLVHLSAL